MRNRDVFQIDPEEYLIANQGVAKIIFPPVDERAIETMRGELRTFVTDGEYGRGLVRIVELLLAAMGHGDQGAVWISGFYGSGKSHLAKMLGALWTDFEFPDGAHSSGLIPEISEDLRAGLRARRRRAAAVYTARAEVSATAQRIQFCRRCTSCLRQLVFRRTIGLRVLLSGSPMRAFSKACAAGSALASSHQFATLFCRARFTRPFLQSDRISGLVRAISPIV